MKSLRLGLVLLLVLLLPVRGALAAAMLCAPAGKAGSIELRHEAGEAAPEHHAVGHDTSASADAHAEPDHCAHEDAGGQHAGHGESAQDRCNMCAASCSAVPLASASTAIEDRVVLSSVSFPDLVAGAPTFQSDGQERPPRTC